MRSTSFDNADNLKAFLIGLALVIIFLIVNLYFLHKNLLNNNYIDLSVISILVYILMSVLLYIIVRQLLVKSLHSKFLGLTFANVLIKFLVTFLLLFTYYNNFSPSDNNFVLPYLLIYIVFTVFEAWFMLRMSDSINPRKNLNNDTNN